MSRFVFAIAIVSVLTGTMARQSCAELSTHRVEFEFLQVAMDSGGVKYGLEIAHRLTPIGTGPLEKKLISPSGMEFVDTQRVSPSRYSFAASTFSELASNSFGDWTVVEKYGSVELSYIIDVASFDLGDVDSDIPIITSPHPGATVREQFEVKWTHLSGTEPRRGGFRVVNRENIVPTFPEGKFLSGECCAILLDAPLAGAGVGKISVSANTWTPLPNPGLIGDVPIPGDNFVFGSSFRSDSTVITYTVVPEPSTLLLVLAGSSLLAIRRR